MMSTPADDNLADDDLDSTAKLPIPSFADFADAPLDVDDATGEYPTQRGATAAQTEINLTQLHARHDSLQCHHADLLIHSQAVSRDRDRLAEESLLWLASRQQLQDQLDQQRVETSTALLNLQQSLEQQEHTGGELHQQLTEQRAEADQLRQQHTRQISDLTRQLEAQRQHGEALQTELLTAQQQFAEQHTSAAALARSMAQALREKDDLQRSLVAREQRIAALDSRFSDTSAQLARVLANEESLVQSVVAHQQEIDERARQAAELHRDLTLTRERIEQLVSEVESEQSRWRSAEQDKERLLETVATERETLEHTRRELSARQAEIGTLQDELNRALVDNDQLGHQLAERIASLNARQQVIASQARELLVLQEAQATLIQRESTLQDSVLRLREELGQLQLQLQERDQTVVVQAERIANLSATLQLLQDELAAKHLEQGASARQVEALQVELHQHVEAMQAIRRDIHQVALQTRKNEAGTLLRTLTRDDAERVVHLLNKSSISVGRDPECDIQLQPSSVSRYHAVLRISHDAVIFEDMNSTNGCYVNGRRIKRQLLKDGDMLKVGAVPLRFGSRATQD